MLKQDEINHSVVTLIQTSLIVQWCTIEEFVSQTGYKVNEVIGKNCRFLQGPETDPNDNNSIRMAIKKTTITIDILNYKKNGEKFWNRLRIKPLFEKR